MKYAAEKAGLTDVRTNAQLRVVGSWRGYRATFQVLGGGRSGPEYASVEIAAAGPARLVVRQRTRFNIVFGLFGPPIVKTPFDEEYLVRTDDTMLAERILGDAKIGVELHSTIVERRDELKLDTHGVRVLRVTGSIRRDQAARAAWQLASTVVEQLGLPRVGSGDGR